MLRQVQQMQDKMSKVQAELERETVQASAGGGAVTVVATGTQKIVSVRIDPEAAGDVEMLEDLVVAAVSQAQQRAAELYQAEVKKLASGLPFPFQLPL